MNIEIRKIIYKITILHKFCRWLVDVNNLRFFRQFNLKSNNLQKLRQYKNSAKNKRCFIVGNGPSLRVDDLEKLVNEDCFAANLIYKIFPKTSWRPKYYFIQDRYADVGSSIDCLEVENIFIGDYFFRKRGCLNKNCVCYHSKSSFDNDNVGFSLDISDYIISHYTVTYSMIQVAVYMGYKEIYLLGIDHNYSLQCDSKGKVIKNNVRSHFFDDNHPKDVIANIEGMNAAYLKAKKFLSENNIKIYNCTRGGKLEWFSRKNIEDISFL